MINVEQISDSLKISYIDNHGQISFENIKLDKNELFEWIENPKGNFSTWNDIKISKKPKTVLNKYRIIEIINSLDDEIQNKIFSFNKPKNFSIIIETDTNCESSNYKNPKAQILSINVLSFSNNTVFTLGLKQLNKDASKFIESKINDYVSDFNQTFKFNYRMFETEYEMLYSFFGALCKKMPSILNWSINDNWNYLVARAKKLGINVYISSPTNKFFDQNLPMHRFVVDYMKLFEYLDTTIKVKEDLSLDWVAKNVLGKGRINYKATLKNLYDNDYLNFIVRNVIDTILIKLINDKFNLIDLVLILTNSTKVSFYDCMSMITMIESVCIKEAKKKNKIILPNKNVKKQHYIGGYNMEPQKDLFDNIALFDCQSMYVSIIMQWNISPDVQCFENNLDCINTYNGLKFKKNEDGIFKSVISNLYNQRIEANKLAIEYKMEIEKLKTIYKNKNN